MNHSSAIDDLESYLNEEAHVIRSAKLEDLLQLEKKHQDILTRLDGISVHPSHLSRLRDQAHRNKELLTAASAGIRSAIQRLEELRRSAGPINSYSSDGKPYSIGSKNSTIERKA